MADTLFSPSWYRVADLKPRIRNHALIHRHEYRGKVWYILQDNAGGRSHRFSPAAYRFIGLMDGQHTVHQLWEATNEQAGDDAPTQDDIIRLLGQLHAADALICDVPPDSKEILRRYQRHERMQWKRRLWTPLAIRFPLFDPDRFLDRTLPYVSPLLTWFGALLWLLVVALGGVLAVVHWQELTKNISDQILTPANLILLWLVYPVVKAIHELGHAYMAKKAGAEVHEIGIMFLVLVPVPYVDVSAAWGIRDKYKRVLIGAAGIVVELFLGSLALFTWLNVQEGSVHAIAYNVILISGVSTLLFNGNPLLRFDGYYVLADFLEIPNLGARSNKYLGYLFQRYLFRSREAESPANSRGEKFWFVLYGIASFIYRMFIMFAIILYIAGKFFIVGVALAAWATITQLFIPLGKNMKFLFNSPRLKRNRGRAVTVTALIVGVIGGLLFALPAPHWTRIEGVTWPSEKSQVRTNVDGFISKLLVSSGARVAEGDNIIETHDPFLRARVDLLEAHIRGLESELLAAQALDRVQAAVIKEELTSVRADLEYAKSQLQDLVIKSPREGVLVIPSEQDLPGRFIRKGQMIAFVVDPSDHLTVRAVVSQDDIGMVRENIRKVDVIPVGYESVSFPASIRREVPGGTNQLPTAALGIGGGGNFAVDPSDRYGRTTLEPVFEFEIGLPEEAITPYLGSRMFVRIDHGYEPLGFQLYRSLRQLLLRRFSV